MATKADAKKLAATLSATIDESSGGPQGEILIEAPRDHHWAATGAHEMVIVWTSGLKSEAWQEAYEIMQAGVASCYDEHGSAICAGSFDGICEWWQ